MAKRFTDTEKWQDDWFIGLEPEHKILWIYICDRSDHAGIWKVSEAIPSRLIGFKVNLAEAMQAFGDRVNAFRDGYWQLTKFIAFQYGLPLNRANKTHLSALRILESYGLETKHLEAASKGQARPLEGVKDKDKDKDIKELNQEPIDNETSEGKGWPWGILMDVFKDHGVPVTERPGRLIGIVNARGCKLTQAEFRATVEAYCKDSFYIGIGRNADTFLKKLDTFLDKVRNKPKSAKEQADIEYKRRKQDTADLLARMNSHNPEAGE